MRPPKPHKPLRCALYVRCSTDDQAYGDYTTIDSQREINRERILHLGGELVAEYNDEGRTGTNLKRPDWKRLLADAREHKFDRIVVTYMSRLARGELYHVAEYLLGECKVKVELVREDFTPDLAGQMSKGIKIVFDGALPRQISEWTKTKQGQMVIHGYAMGGVRPFGYSTETVPGMTPSILPGGKVKPAPKRYVPNPEEAPIVLRAFERFVETDNLGQVQRYLREVAPTRTWTIEAVRRLLSNPISRGAVRWGVHTNPSAHEAIVPDTLWEAAQAQLAARQEKRAPVGGEGRELGYAKPSKLEDDFCYFLRGRVLCEHCGSRMTPASHHGRSSRVRYYECIRSAKTGKPCPVKRVNAETLQTAVLSEIARCGEHPTRLATFIREAAKAMPSTDEAREEIKRLERNKREAEKKIKANQMALEVGSTSGTVLTTLVKRLGELEAHITEIECKRQDLMGQIASFQYRRPDAEEVASLWQHVMDIWEFLSGEERTELIGLLVEEVTMVEKQKAAVRLNLTSGPLQVRHFEPHGCESASKSHIVHLTRLRAALLQKAPVAPSTCTLPLAVLLHRKPKKAVHQ